MPAVSALSPAGSTLPRKPKALRPATICGTPKRGPARPRKACATEPSAVPSTSASTACPKPSPNTSTASTPTKTVANSMFGEVQVHSSCSGPPCLASAGIGSAPVGSTART